MFNHRIRKIIFLLSIALTACGSVGIYVYYSNLAQGPIYDFNPARDTQPIMDIFNKNWYWLLASEESSPAFMIKNRTHDTNPMHFGSLHIKVLRENNKLVGFTAYYMNNPQEGRILFLAVDHEFRGKGYGKILAQRAMNELFKMGAIHLALWTRVSNLPAQRIYKELGFKEVFDENGYVFFEYHPEK